MNPWCIRHDRDEEQKAMDLASMQEDAMHRFAYSTWPDLLFSVGVIACSINAPLTGAFITSDKAL